MARRSIAERIAQLEVRKKALQARLSKQERATDTRRKVLLGALVLQRLQTADDPEFTRRLRGWLRRELPGFLTREGDHALFPEFIDQAPVGGSSGAGGRRVEPGASGGRASEGMTAPQAISGQDEIR